MSPSARRISVGFKGGQVLAVRVSDSELSSLYDALPGGGWHECRSEDGPVRIDLGQVVYISAESDELRVGFS